MNYYAAFAELYYLFYAGFEDDLAMYAGFAERTGGRVLEIGSGTGRVAIALAEDGHRVTGLELSAEMLSIAQQKVLGREIGDRVTLVQGDMRRFKIEDHFGLVIAPINTFLHNLTLDDQLAALSGIKAHLRPGGLLVLDCFNPDPAFATDDRRLIVQRSVLDRATGQTALLFMTRATDWGNQTQEITYIVDRSDEQGSIRRTVFSISFRFIFRHEMHLLLKHAGFDLKDMYGSYELDPFEAASDKLIVVATPA